MKNTITNEHVIGEGCISQVDPKISICLINRKNQSFSKLGF